MVGPANPAPSIAATIGTQPDMRAKSWKVELARAKWRESCPSWMRWPPPSSRSTSGTPCCIACPASRRSFSLPSTPEEPPSTEKSCAATIAQRPSIRAAPVTMPSAGARGPNSGSLTSAPISVKLPGSHSMSIRSRAVCSARARCFATAADRCGSMISARAAAMASRRPRLSSLVQRERETAYE
ncbi:MAG: hypothetical protein QM771_14865 [Nitrospira sp.]